MPDAEIVGHDEDPLTTADVEREFASSTPRAVVPAPSGPSRTERVAASSRCLTPVASSLDS